MKHFNNNTASYQSRFPNIDFEVSGAQESFSACSASGSEIRFSHLRMLSDWIYLLLVGLFSMVNNVFEFMVGFLKQTKLLPYFRFAMLVAFMYLAFYQNAGETMTTYSSGMETPPMNDTPSALMAGMVSSAQKSKKKKDPFAEAYIERFAKVAQVEMDKFGIPASIKLAQGLLESNAGKSRLAAEHFNHFGLKCFSKTCDKGHCSNHIDDSHKDFFRNYKSAWESWRDHSQFLSGERYMHLKSNGKDYKKWARGLKKAGYATDKSYAKKLVHIIELYDLDRFDQ